MIYSYLLSEEAENDVYEAYEWYENQKKGLGEGLLRSLDFAQEAILNNPLTYRVCYKKKVRRFVMHTFPYLIFYIVNKQEIHVIAVFNTHQHPKRWKKRVF